MRKAPVIVADVHSGHPLALPPGPDGWTLADGNFIETNDWQKVLWQHMVDSALHVADLRGRNSELIVIHAGDPKEGLHHGNVQIITPRDDEQERMHVATMQEFLRLAKYNPRKGDKQIFLTGTEAHCGPGNSSTERIARALLKTDDLDGSVIRPRLYARVNGVLFDVAHKGYRLGGRSWSRTNSMRAWLESYWDDALKHQRPMPRYVIRAHQHTYGYAELCDDMGLTVSEAFLMASWKLVDDYVRTIQPEAVSNIGLLAFVIEDNGQSKSYPMLMRCEQDEIEEL